MNSTILGALNATHESPDIQAIVNDIAALKADIAALATHIKASAAAAASAATSAAGKEGERLGHEAQRLYGRVAAESERSVRAVGKQIEEQPVASLLTVFVIGFLASRLFSKVV